MEQGQLQGGLRLEVLLICADELVEQVAIGVGDDGRRGCSARECERLCGAGFSFGRTRARGRWRVRCVGRKLCGRGLNAFPFRHHDEILSNYAVGAVLSEMPAFAGGGVRVVIDAQVGSGSDPLIAAPTVRTGCAAGFLAGRLCVRNLERARRTAATSA
jgi:hypothetical protein